MMSKTELVSAFTDFIAEWRSQTRKEAMAMQRAQCQHEDAQAIVRT